MRKLMAWVTALLMLTASGLAEGMNLSAYDDAALAALLTQVQEEIAARGICRVATAPAGTYVCGLDIPAGKYILTSDGSQTNAHGIVEWTRYFDAERKDYDHLYYEHWKGEEAYTVYLSLQEGDVLVLPFTHTLTITPGILFQ